MPAAHHSHLLDRSVTDYAAPVWAPVINDITWKHLQTAQYLVVWRSGNVVGQISEVTLRQARLVLGWVTVYGWVNHLGM